jgi:ligand-binding sensor domain-containing protein
MKIKFLFISIALMLFAFSSSCGTTNQSKKHSDIRYITWQEDKYLWASENNKVIRWDTRTRNAEIFKGISGKLFIDSENNIWVFGKSTISHFDGQEWQQFMSGNEFASGPIFSFAEVNGYIWVGTSGLSRYSQQSKSWQILFQTPPGPTPTPVPQGIVVEVLPDGVHSIATTNKKAVWVGTTRGLTYWKDNFQQTWTNNDLNTDGIRCLLGISDDEVWICTEQGIGRWNGVQLVDFFKDASDHKQLVQGEGQHIWVTGSRGVARWNGVSWSNWTDTQEPTSLPKTNSLREAYSLVVSTIDSNIWVVSAEGITRWDEQRWRTYTRDDGLIADFTYMLIQDTRGVLWAGTNNGIYFYDPDTDQWQDFP